MIQHITISEEELVAYRDKNYPINKLTHTSEFVNNAELSSPKKETIQTFRRQDLIIDPETFPRENIDSQQEERLKEYLELKRIHDKEFLRELKEKGLTFSLGDQEDKKELQY